MSLYVPKHNDPEWEQGRLRELANIFDMLEESDGIVGQEATTLLERMRAQIDALRQYSGF